MTDLSTDDFPSLDSLLQDAQFESDDMPTPEPVLDENGKKPRKKRSDAGQPRGPRGATGARKPRGGMSAADKKLADELLNPWAKLCTALAMVAPTVSGVMSMRGEASMQGLVALASPKMKEALTKAAKTGPGLDLAETILMVMVAAAVDFGKVDPDSPIAFLTGVRSVYDAVHPDREERHAPAAQEGQTFAPPPMGFAPFPGS